MRRFDAIWKFASGSYSDQTSILGEGSSSVTLSAGETLYFGMEEDWLAGILAFLSVVPSPTPVYILEQFDGDTWRSLPLEESIVNLSTGVELQRGSMFWGYSPWKWAQLSFSNTDPEAGTALDNLPRYWVRLSLTSGSITIDRTLPQLFNTYATVTDMEHYIGVTFDDLTPPTRDTVRKMLRANEDWLDQYTRRSFRPRIAYNETHDFNAYGVRLRRYPAWFAVSVGLWNGSSFESMNQGRGSDYFLDPNSGMLRFLLPSFRFRYYSFLLSRYMRQPNSLSVTYAYGEDFDTSRYAMDVRNIILKKTGAELVNQADWTGVFTSGLDTVSKSEKLKNWEESGMAAADELRMPLIG